MFFDDTGRIVLKQELKHYRPREAIPREFLSDEAIQHNAGSTLFFDVECYPNYFCVNFKLINTNSFIVFECGQDKSFNERKLAWLLNSYRTVGFNSIKYDLIMTWLAYSTQDTSSLKSASNDLIVQGLRKKDMHEKYSFRSFNTNHVDLIEVAPLKGSLKLYGARLHSKRIQDLPFPDTAILTPEEINIVRDYNFTDLDVTEQLFHFMKERLELREAMGREYNEDLMSKSDAQIAEVVLSKEVGKINGKRPQRPTVPAGTSFQYKVPAYIQYQTPVLQAMLERIRKAIFVVGETGKVTLPDELATAVKVNKGVYRLGIGGLHSSEKNMGYVATAIDKADKT